jgi:Tfp pilus assembly protein PilN
VINKLNLATHPFRNRTLPYLIAMACCTLALVGVIFGFAKLRQINEETEMVQRQIREMEGQMAELKSKGDEVQKNLTPEQKTLLIAAHKLVAQKSFGWSRLFADLESVLPGGVSVSRINVENVYQTGDRTQAELELSVLSKDYQSVMNMIDTMNSRPIFQAELRGQDLQKKEYFSYTEYTLRLVYTQPLGYSTAPPAPPSDVASVAGKGGQQ